MTDDIEVVDISDERHEQSYEREKSYDEIQPSSKKPLSSVSHVTPSGFKVPRSLDLGNLTREEGTSLSNGENDDEILIKPTCRCEAWARESRPATSPFARQPSRSSSNSAPPSHGNIGVPTNKKVDSMAYSPDTLATPSKKRRIGSLGTRTPSGNESPQWTPNGPLPASTNTVMNSSYQPRTPVKKPSQVSPPQYGMFSRQARSQRNGTQAVLQPPPPGFDPQASFTAALTAAVPLLTDLEAHFLRPLNDLARNVKTLEATIASQNATIKHLKAENAELRQHVDASFADQASRAREAVSEVKKNVEELHVRVILGEMEVSQCREERMGSRG